MASAEHIVIVTPGFPANEEDTTCIPALHLYVRALRESGATVSVCALHYPFRQDKYNWFGVTVYPLNGRNRRIYRRLWLFRKLRGTFRYIHHSQTVTVIHAFWLNETSVWAVKLGAHFGVPVVASAMGQDVLPENKMLHVLRNRLPQTVISLSPFHGDQLYRTAGIASECVYFGIVPEMFPELEKTIDIVGVGNLIPVKRFDYFLEICAAVATQKPEVTIHLIGGGTEQAALEAQISAAGLTKQVVLHGTMSYPETINLIAASRILLHTSAFEGFGMIFAEAMQARAHLLTSPVGMALTDRHAHHLSMDVKADAEKVLELIQTPAPEPFSYDVKASVTHHLTVYKKVKELFRNSR